MDRWVEISFDCLPLRSMGRFDVPFDASPEQQAFFARINLAMEKHGVHNVFYLHHGQCVFHLTNDPQQGMLDFVFEGVVLTDSADLHTRGVDLDVQLRREVCDWLSTPVIEWFRETVVHAVQVEFDRYIAAGDLQRTMERMKRIQAESDARGGFLGMDL